jgi:putative addiction module component (TIGR02574 family)
MSLDEVKSLALALSSEEQLQLMDDLSESLADTLVSAELSEEQRAELDRRLAQAEADPDSLIPLEEVKRRLSKYT